MDGEGDRGSAFEPGVRKPCLSETEATAYAPGKSEWRQAHY